MMVGRLGLSEGKVMGGFFENRPGRNQLIL
jgi:hypothetical protein